MSRLRPSQWPPACSFGSLVPDEEAQVPGNVEAIHPREGRGCGLGCTGQYSCVRGDKAASFGNLTPWESHTITIFYCATRVFISASGSFRHCEGGSQDPPWRRKPKIYFLFNVALAFMRASRPWPASRHAPCPDFFSATAFNSTRALSIPSRDTFQCVTMRTEWMAVSCAHTPLACRTSDRKSVV